MDLRRVEVPDGCRSSVGGKMGVEWLAFRHARQLMTFSMSILRRTREPVRPDGALVLQELLEKGWARSCMFAFAETCWHAVGSSVRLIAASG